MSGKSNSIRSRTAKQAQRIEERQAQQVDTQPVKENPYQRLLKKLRADNQKQK